MFTADKVDAEPLAGEHAHVIELEERAAALFGPIYPLAEKELEALRLYLEDALERGWI